MHELLCDTFWGLQVTVKAEVEVIVRVKVTVKAEVEFDAKFKGKGYKRRSILSA